MPKFTPRTRAIIKRGAKVAVWTAVGAVLFLFGLMTILVKWLEPERLTPLVHRIGSAYLRADVNVSRVELSFWSTFPRLTLEIDSLEVVSRSLKPLTHAERDSLPAGADTLMTVTAFDGGVNVLPLLIGNIALYDVVIDEPMIRLVSVNDSVANYNIVPPSEPDTTSKPVSDLPDISINRFAITRAKPFSYTSMTSGFSGSVTFRRIEFGGGDAPHYRLELAGDCAAPVLKEYNFTNIVLGLDGKIKWDSDTPTALAVDGLKVDVDEIHAEVDTEVDFANPLTVNSFNFELKPVDISRLLRHVPADYAEAIRPLTTNMRLGFEAKLTVPYCMTDSDMVPSVRASLKIPKCDVAYKNMSVSGFALGVTADVTGGRLTKSPNGSGPTVKAEVKIPDCSMTLGNVDIRRFGLDVDANLTLNNLDKSVVNVKRLLAEGPATLIKVDGRATTLMSDPDIDGNVELRVECGRFPADITRLIPAKIQGHLSADAHVKLKQSYLSLERFHKILMTGDARLTNFTAEMPDATRAWVRDAHLKFGTSTGFINDNHQRVDSLLSASIQIDTASVWSSGISIGLSKLRAGVGTPNGAVTPGPDAVIPIGGRFALGRFNMMSEADSTRVRLRDFECNASLRRFQGNAKVPQLSLDISAKRMSAATPEMRFSLRDSRFGLSAHINPPRRMSPRVQHVYDSIAARHPGLPADSIRSIMRRSWSSRTTQGSGELIDFGLDNSMKELLNRWDVSGSILAKRGRLVTPYLPLRNVLSDVDIIFNTDSVSIRSLRYDMGQSDFRVKGSISNIRRALTSRRGSPLRVDLSMNSDTIHVNELIRALYAGGAMAAEPENAKLAAAMVDSDNDDALEGKIAAAEGAVGALIVPKNIDAHFTMRAKNIIYADMLLKRFKGEVMVYDGAIHLNQLRAYTDMGSIDLTALYTAPDRSNLDFGFGVQIKDFNINKFIGMFPAIDSIMPMLSGFSGIINADIAATTKLTEAMDVNIPTLHAAVKIEGDSLVVLDEQTFRTIAKWALFRNKRRNMIDHMSVEMLIEDSQLEIFPFLLDIDRYRFGVMGHNDLAMNLNYHISVLKSPVPFKFGINIKGNPDKMKIRLGGAKFKDHMMSERVAIVDTTRINLVNQIQNVFRRGMKAARVGTLDVKGKRPAKMPEDENRFTHADSVILIEQGLIEAPPPPRPELSNHPK